MNSGRKRDVIWNEFTELKVADKQGSRAVCKRCNHELQGIVDRMKKHSKFCRKSNENISAEKGDIVPSSSNGNSKQENSKILKFVVTTTKKEKESFDEQVARFFYATNLAFHKSAHTEFKKLCGFLHPGYIPPHEKQLSNEFCKKFFHMNKQCVMQL